MKLKIRKKRGKSTQDAEVDVHETVGETETKKKSFGSTERGWGIRRNKTDHECSRQSSCVCTCMIS